MLTLSDNLYNVQLGRHQPKLKLWRYAGLLLTYRCTAACRFCYYRCSPLAGGLMSVRTAMECWQGLERLAGPEARVHLTGGEPFLYFERLSEICLEARRLGLAPAESVETNAGWVEGQTDAEIGEKLALLKDCGIGRLKISWDPFHEEFVEVEQVRRLVRLAGQLLGPERVLVRWQKHLEYPSGITGLSPAEQEAVFTETLRTDPCRFTGRAAETLAHLAQGQPVEAFEGRNCQNALLDAKGIHVDPEGHIFVGQCSGMLLGNVHTTGIDSLWQTFEPNKMEFWSVLYKEGPVGFLSEAIGAGYRVRTQYASKCHLCTDIRCFFFDKRRYSTIIGPYTCYPNSDTKRT
jgi:hypothetical protein